MAYLNLKAEMVRRRIIAEDIARAIGKSHRTAHDKINGISDFSIIEAFATRDKLFPDLSIEYLFAKI